MIPLNIEIDSTFLHPEERCNFQVNQQRKEVWAVELDLLIKLDQVCKKHGLKYCVGAGTMLGAVRHRGFIPWDDDVDLYMLRDDYDQLMMLSHEFESPYFLQTTYTEKNLLRGYTRLRNVLTTGVTRIDQYRPVNKGIFIDIFPIDGVASDKWSNYLQKQKNKYYRRVFGSFNGSRAIKQTNSAIQTIKYWSIKQFANLLVGNKEDFFKRYEANLKKYSIPSTKLWGNRTLVFECPKSRRPLEDYTDLVMMPFEFIEVPVPRHYDSMLRQQYGDYMKIPENKNGSMHGELIISTDYAYDDPRRTQEQ